METKKIKVSIIGAGNMGGAIARGLLKGNLIEPKNLRVSDISKHNLDALQVINPDIVVSEYNVDIIPEADVIILAVKPWLVWSVVEEIKYKIDYQRQIIISLAAGVDFKQLKEYFDENATLFRLIPNTAIEVLQGVSTIASLNATIEQEQLVVDIFGQTGKSFLVPEAQLNAFMSLSSCGIAYAFRYIRAAMEGGIEMGINPQLSKEVILQTLRGAIELLEATNSHPEAEIDKVTTPGGITIKGLNEMEAHGFTNAVIKGLKASHLK